MVTLCTTDILFADKKVIDRIHSIEAWNKTTTAS